MLDLGLFGSLTTGANTDLRHFDGSGTSFWSVMRAETNHALEPAAAIIDRRHSDVFKLVDILLAERVVTGDRLAEISRPTRTIHWIQNPTSIRPLSDAEAINDQFRTDPLSKISWTPIMTIAAEARPLIQAVLEGDQAMASLKVTGATPDSLKAHVTSGAPVNEIGGNTYIPSRPFAAKPLSRCAKSSSSARSSASLGRRRDHTS